MTARHHIRIGNRRLGRDRAAIDATPAPRLGEMLQLARERKGVDLFRAERDTKIRLRYLAALEDSHFEDLPAAVYTKGFLRNYAIYLGLDPEEVLERWRDETTRAPGRRPERPVVVAPPRPISSPRRAPTVSAGWLITALVLLAFAGFVGYIAIQLMRFAETPAVSLTSPASLVSQANAEAIMLEGTSGPGSLITIHTPDGQLLTTTADETGQWSREVPLAPGRNDFSVVANDPVTRRDSAPLQLIVNVPLALESPAASASAPPPELRLSLTNPRDGATTDTGRIGVNGSTSGGRVTIEAVLLEPPPGSLPSPTPDDQPSPAGEASPQGSPPSSPLPPAGPVDLTVPTGGRFSHTLELAPGRWEIVVTAYSSGLQPISERRTITVNQAAEFVLVIEAARGDSWLRIVPDGEVMRGWGGPTLRRGSSVTVTATNEIWLRTGNAGVLRVTQNGVDLGQLGRKGQVGNWIFRPGAQPEQTSESR